MSEPNLRQNSLFGPADTTGVSSSGGARVMLLLGLPANGVVSALFVVENARRLAASRQADRARPTAPRGGQAYAPGRSRL